jgi:hypothetical protein
MLLRNWPTQDRRSSAPCLTAERRQYILNMKFLALKLLA